MITAIVLIQAEADAIPDAAQAIADIEGVGEVYSCAGDVDLIATVQVSTKKPVQSIALSGGIWMDADASNDRFEAVAR